MSERAALPNWVTKRDGRLVPFDGDRICRAVFAAGERTGRPDPFLARELTDGVLHFLAEDGATDPLPTDQLADVILKVVRELGHPALAQSFAQYRTAKVRRSQLNLNPISSDDTLARFVASRPTARELIQLTATESLAAFSRKAVYSPDLVAAERERLLQLFDLHTPLELAGGVIEPKPPVGQPGEFGWVEALEAAREQYGSFVAIDSPEHTLAPLNSLSLVRSWLRELRIGLRLTDLRVAINLNTTVPPCWAETAAAGPLFPALSADEGQRYADLSDILLEHLLDADSDQLRIDWHLGERDFLPGHRNRLLRLARRVIEGAPVTFVPDRPRRPVVLAEGLDRQNPAVLGVVGVNLTRLLSIVRTDEQSSVEPPVLLKKLASLARLALSVGHARREYLRRNARPVVTRGFLLDRARLVVTPLGLDAAVQAVTGQGAADGSAGLEFSRQILQSLYATLQNDLAGQLPACLDSPPLGLSADVESAGPTPRQQIRAAGVQHTAAGAGTAVVQLGGDRAPTAEEIAHLLWYAWQQPGLVRVRFVRASRPQRQLFADW
jgi:hypothetical protein